MSKDENAPAEGDDLADVAPLEPPADDETAEADAPEVDEAAGEGPADEADEAPVEDPQAPAVAQIDPPKPNPVDANPGQIEASPADASAERLRLDKRVTGITDDQGNEVDPEGLFVDAGDGYVKSTVRLHERGTITEHERPVERLLLAAGQRVSKRSAQIILNRLAAQAPAEDEVEG